MVDSGPICNNDFLPFLLGSTSPAAFIDEYWGYKPLLVKGHPDKFSPLFSRASLERLGRLRSSISPPPPSGTPSSRWTMTGIFPGGQVTEIRPEELDSAVSAGATIHVKNLHLVDATVSKLCAALKSELTFAGRVNSECVLAVPHSRIPNHIDNESVFSMQIEGARHWRISAHPVIQWPHRTIEMAEDQSMRYKGGAPCDDQVEQPKPDQFLDFVVEPGDMLF